MLFVGVLMILYVGFAVLGLVSSSARHYATFVLFVMVMSSLASIKVLAYERLGIKMVEEGYAEAISGPPANTPWLLWVKGALALVGALLAIAGAAYILAHADRLERAAPFFENFDMVMGSALAAGVVLLTLVHWGTLLASIVALAIAYFFLGQHIDHPLLSHPGYDTGFILNYLGLGVTQGLFLYA